MKSILVLGAGRSSSTLIKHLLNRAEELDWKVVVGDIDLATAKSKVGGHARGEAFELSAVDNVERDRRIAAADIVMSMVPAFLHASVAKVAIANGVNMITPSYVSPEMQGLDEEAKKAGVLVLNEIGLDPGIDHMSAMRVIDQLKSEGAIIMGFESYCGGLVAPDSDNNPWHYKISWNPRNVVLAGQGGSATFKEEGRVKMEPTHRVFKKLREVKVGGREYMGYPNRDSLAYTDIYGLKDVDTLIRGTLRGEGYCEAWDVLVQLGMVNDDAILKISSDMSWHDWTLTFLPASGSGKPIENRIVDATDCTSRDIERIKWLGLLDHKSRPSRTEGTPAEYIQDLIEEKWKLESDDRDMIVMWHRFEFVKDGVKQEITSELALEGADQTYTAMSDTVGLPMALAAEHILEGPGFGRTGVDIPVTPEYYEPMLNELEKLGIAFTENHRNV